MSYFKDKEDYEQALGQSPKNRSKNNTSYHTLTARQKLFGQIYAEEFSLKKACDKTGIEEQTAMLLLSQPIMRAYIDRQNDLAAERAGVTKQYILNTLKRVVDKSLQAEPVLTYDPIRKDMVETGQYVFNDRGANKALELMAKHMGMLDGGGQFNYSHGSKAEAEQNSRGTPIQIINDIPRSDKPHMPLVPLSQENTGIVPEEDIPDIVIEYGNDDEENE